MSGVCCMQPSVGADVLVGVNVVPGAFGVGVVVGVGVGGVGVGTGVGGGLMQDYQLLVIRVNDLMQDYRIDQSKPRGRPCGQIVSISIPPHGCVQPHPASPHPMLLDRVGCSHDLRGRLPCSPALPPLGTAMAQRGRERGRSSTLATSQNCYGS